MAKPFVKQDWQAKIIAHAWKDPKFKKELETHPKEALKKIGCNVPEHLHVKIIEEKDNTWTIVLPKLPVDARNLSKADLLHLSRGGTISQKFKSMTPHMNSPSIERRRDDLSEV